MGVLAGESVGGRKIAMVIVAAGQGLRAGEGLPKQYRLLNGRAVLAHTLRALHLAVPEARCVVVIHPDHGRLLDSALAGLAIPPPTIVHGAASRQASVLAGLEALAVAAPDIVLIHDAARPFATPALIWRAIAAAARHVAAIPGTAMTDSVKVVDVDEMVADTPPRAALRAVQTPQAFDFRLILAAHRAAASAGRTDCNDDAAVAELAGHRVHVFEGEAENIKLTTAADFTRAGEYMRKDLNDIRTGQGYDVHAFGPGDHVWLGGLQIPHDQGLVGHSDADVLLHAITDAILGAIGDGDIGAHFPPSDMRWKSAASAVFLADAMARVAARGGIVAHIDATLVCETPKIAPYREAIRASIAGIAGLALDRVAVKATTSERLGFTGRREGMATLAIATVRLPGN